MFKFEDGSSLHNSTRSSPSPSRNYHVYTLSSGYRDFDECEKSSPHRKRKHSALPNDSIGMSPTIDQISKRHKRNAYTTPPNKQEIALPVRPVKPKRNRLQFRDSVSRTLNVREVSKDIQKRNSTDSDLYSMDRPSHKRKIFTENETDDINGSSGKKIKVSRERGEEQKPYDNKSKVTTGLDAREAKLNLLLLQQSNKLLSLVSHLIKQKLREDSYRGSRCNCSKQQRFTLPIDDEEPELPYSPEIKTAQPPTYTDSIFNQTSDYLLTSDKITN